MVVVIIGIITLAVILVGIWFLRERTAQDQIDREDARTIHEATTRPIALAPHGSSKPVTNHPPTPVLPVVPTPAAGRPVPDPDPTPLCIPVLVELPGQAKDPANVR